MQVLGIDPSLTATGLALPDGTTRVLRTKMPKGGHKHVREVERLIGLRDRVLPFLDGVDLVVIEGYSYGSGFQAHQLGELGGVLRVLLTEAGVPWVEVAPTRVKRYATGKGNANKAAVLAAARAAGVDTADDNAADAWWLRAIGVHALTGDPVPTVGLSADRSSIAAEVEVPKNPPSLLA